MVLAAIFKILKTVLDAVFKFLAWLLLTLGLWIPLLYTLLFVIVAALSEIPLSQAATPFFIGLFVSLIASMLFSFYLSGGRRRKKKQNAAPVAGMDKLEKRQDKARLVRKAAFNEKAAEKDPLDEPPPRPPKEKEPPPAERKKNIIELAKRDVYGEDLKSEGGKEESAPAAGSEEAAADPAPALVLKQNYRPHEAPRIFATRADPTVFVYEYSDRIDYYKRTRLGMIYMYSSYKQ